MPLVPSGADGRAPAELGEAPIGEAGVRPHRIPHRVGRGRAGGEQNAPAGRRQGGQPLYERQTRPRLARHHAAHDPIAHDDEYLGGRGATHDVHRPAAHAQAAGRGRLEGVDPSAGPRPTHDRATVEHSRRREMAEGTGSAAAELGRGAHHQTSVGKEVHEAGCRVALREHDAVAQAPEAARVLLHAAGAERPGDGVVVQCSPRECDERHDEPRRRPSVHRGRPLREDGDEPHDGDGEERRECDVATGDRLEGTEARAPDGGRQGRGDGEAAEQEPRLGGRAAVTWLENRPDDAHAEERQADRAPPARDREVPRAEHAAEVGEDVVDDERVGRPETDRRVMPRMLEAMEVRGDHARPDAERDERLREPPGGRHAGRPEEHAGRHERQQHQAGPERQRAADGGRERGGEPRPLPAPCAQGGHGPAGRQHDQEDAELPSRHPVLPLRR